MRVLDCLMFAALFTGCGKKASAPESPAASGPAITVNLPDTPHALGFAKTFLAAEVRGFSPTGNSDFTWIQAEFRPDGTFRAEARLKVGVEEVECPESGSWSIEEAESTSRGTMEWTVVKTSCPTRENGTVSRVQVTVTDGQVKISRR